MEAQSNLANKKFHINEIFYSLQSEGTFAGTAATFVRFAGCNLKCVFCDTDFTTKFIMSQEEIVDALLANTITGHFVFTGGEPTMQDIKSLGQALHKDRTTFIELETNGYLTEGYEEMDWITLSPKVLERTEQYCDALKIVYGLFDMVDVEWWFKEYCFARNNTFNKEMHPFHLFLQPMFYGDEKQMKENIKECVAYIKADPKWRLSLQWHKMIDIP